MKPRPAITTALGWQSLLCWVQNFVSSLFSPFAAALGKGKEGFLSYPSPTAGERAKGGWHGGEALYSCSTNRNTLREQSPKSVSLVYKKARPGDSPLKQKVQIKASAIIQGFGETANWLRSFPSGSGPDTGGLSNLSLCVKPLGESALPGRCPNEQALHRLAE